MWFCQIRPPCKSNYACTLDQVSFQSGLRIFEDNAVFVSTAGAPVVIIVQGVSIDPSIHPLQSKTGNDRRGFLKRGFLKEEDVMVKYTLFESCMAFLFKATLILLTLIALVPVPLPCQPFFHPLRQWSSCGQELVSSFSLKFILYWRIPTSLSSD